MVHCWMAHEEGIWECGPREYTPMYSDRIPCRGFLFQSVEWEEMAEANEEYEGVWVKKREWVMFFDRSSANL